MFLVLDGSDDNDDNGVGVSSYMIPVFGLAS